MSERKPKESRILGRAGFQALVAAAAGISALSPGVLSGAPTTSKLIPLCLALGLIALLRSGYRPLRWCDLAIALPALMMLASSSEVAAWAGLAFTTLLWVRTGGKSDAARPGLWIIAAVALRDPLMLLAGDLFGAEIIALDARLVAGLLTLMGEEPAASGAVLQTAEGHPLLLLWNCSLFGNLSLALLLWLSLSLLAAQRLSLNLWVYGALALAAVVAVNTGRLAAMAWSLSGYDWLHQGDGAAFLRLLLYSLVITITFLGIRHHAAQTAGRL